MLLIHGVYHFRPKRAAFRNDYCNTCGLARRAEQIRTFDALHLFWIPIIPLGFKKRWICTFCGRETNFSTKTRRGFKWAGLFVLLIFSVFAWAGPIPSDFLAGGWIIRIGAPIGAILVLAHLLRAKKDLSREERLKAIPGASDTVCPFCGVELLILASQCSCPVCGVVRT